MAKVENFEPQVNLNPAIAPILYTDMIFMNINEDGVTLDICQKMGATNQFNVITRIGMSREHAQKLTKQLSDMLALTTAHSQTGKKN